MIILCAKGACSLSEQHVEALARLGKRERAANDLGAGHRSDGDANATGAGAGPLVNVRALGREEGPLKQIALNTRKDTPRKQNAQKHTAMERRVKERGNSYRVNGLARRVENGDHASNGHGEELVGLRACTRKKERG